MWVLIIGRILGGLSTSLLFSAFESWMVSEHRRLKFHDDLLASTFSISSAGNGISAISAGFLAQLAAGRLIFEFSSSLLHFTVLLVSDRYGDIGPFQLAIALTVVTLVIVLFWHENYGSAESSADEKKNDKEEPKSFFESLMIAINTPQILLVGLSQACFEGTIFTFGNTTFYSVRLFVELTFLSVSRLPVFLWVPTLQALITGPLHTGLVFSAFMLAMTLGGLLSSLLLPLCSSDGVSTLCTLVFFVAAGAMAMPLIAYDFWSVLLAFLLLETMVGMFNSLGGMLRSKFYPEHLQSSVMSVFRLPLNILVVVGTRLADQANDESSRKQVFGIMVIVLTISAIMQLALMLLPATPQVASAKKQD